MLLELEDVLHAGSVGLEVEWIALTGSLTGGVRQPPDKLHVLRAGLVEAAALTESLELDRARGGEGVLLLEISHSHRLHGLVSLHQQLADLLQHLQATSNQSNSFSFLFSL